MMTFFCNVTYTYNIRYSGKGIPYSYLLVFRPGLSTFSRCANLMLYLYLNGFCMCLLVLAYFTFFADTDKASQGE